MVAPRAAITEWIPRWRKNGWKTALSKPVKNQEDIERLDRLCQQVNVKWVRLLVRMLPS